MFSSEKVAEKICLSSCEAYFNPDTGISATVSESKFNPLATPFKPFCENKGDKSIPLPFLFICTFYTLFFSKLR